MTTTKLIKMENSQAVLIPEDICEKAGLRIGDRITIGAEDGVICMRHFKKPHYQRERIVTIDELFKGYERNYHPQELDWGPPVGEEM